MLQLDLAANHHSSHFFGAIDRVHTLYRNGKFL